VQIQLGYATHLLAFDVFVQIELKGALERAPRFHVRAVPFVANCDIPEELPFEFQVGVHVLKLNPRRCGQSVAPAI
jgi:hypothetical protein